MEMTVLALPEGIKKIHDGQYKGRKDISNVIFPSSLEEIGKEAFEGCENVRFFLLNEGIKIIGDNAFSRTNAFIYIPSSLEYIGKEAIGYDSKALFEAPFGSFKTYLKVYPSEPDYPDSFHRGPSMGGGESKVTYYFGRNNHLDKVSKVDLALYQDFLPYEKEGNLSFFFPAKESEYEDIHQLAMKDKIAGPSLYSFISEFLHRKYRDLFIIKGKDGKALAYLVYDHSYISPFLTLLCTSDTLVKEEGEAFLRILKRIGIKEAKELTLMPYCFIDIKERLKGLGFIPSGPYFKLKLD